MPSQLWVLCFVASCLILEQSTDGMELVNVALKKPTKQIDDFDATALAYKAVDGNRASHYFSGSCSATKRKSDTFWIVDLLFTYHIHSVAITNRNVFNNRLQNFYIYVSNVNPYQSLLSKNPTGQLCIRRINPLPPAGPHSLSCGNGIIGRYVYVWKPGNTLELTLCEFEAMVDKETLNNINEIFSIFDGRKSPTNLFHSSTTQQLSIPECIQVCLSTPGGYATLVQLEKATRRCDCIQESGLSDSTSDVLDNGWILIKSLGNENQAL